MMTAALTGRAIARGPSQPRTLVCTADGVWVWPGTPLTERRGAVLVPIPASQLYQHVATLYCRRPLSGPQKETGGVSPREYLKGKTPAERYQFGLGVLRKFGVLQ